MKRIDVVCPIYKNYEQLERLYSLLEKQVDVKIANYVFPLTISEDEELNEKLKSLKIELFNLRFSHATGGLKNPVILNTTKKDIAKVKTILRERELNAKNS